MPASSLLALLDDIATALDDIAVMTKVAAQKTAGVLGDDLALNAHQVGGVRAERELPVVWAVAKGSLLNKLILVPAALALSVLAPVAVLALLMAGGAYLCFEGAEKLLHRFSGGQHTEAPEAGAAPIDPVAFEKEKIAGAVRTDFVLSAEIIVIALGTVQASAFVVRASVVAGVAVMMTVGVYGLVAAIVKLDDAGLALVRRAEAGRGSRASLLVGRALLAAAPKLMKTLAVVGTAAMFLVGGGILVHAVTPVAALEHTLVHAVHGLPGLGAPLAAAAPLLFNALLGLAAGTAMVAATQAGRRLWGRRRPAV